MTCLSVGDFSRIHPMPQSGQDVPDDLDTRLVVLGIDHPYTKDTGSAAESKAKAILESRGNTPRLYRNTLVFLAADKTRLQDLDEAARKYLAWESILAEKVTLNLDPQQVKHAEVQKAAADGAVTARLPETCQWLLVPTQKTPQATIEWHALRLSGQDVLAVRASKKLKSDELMITGFAVTRLRMELDRIPLWRGDHVAIKQLVENFARYIYLPRLKDPSVLLSAICDGFTLMFWKDEPFAYADGFDETAGRYLGLRGGQPKFLADSDASGSLVKPEVACKQLDTESVKRTEEGLTKPGGGAGSIETPPKEPVTPKSKRFHGAVTLDTTRVGRDASRIADEMNAHLSGLVGVKVTVTLEVEAEIPSGYRITLSVLSPRTAGP